jgi:hypothetical protein
MVVPSRRTAVAGRNQLLLLVIHWVSGGNVYTTYSSNTESRQ